MKPIGEALKELLAERGWTVTELWAAADLSPAVTYRYLTGERGRRMNSQALATVEKLARALEVEPEYFLEYRQAKAEKLVRQAMREGLISLEALEMLVEGARVRRGAQEADE